jgi:hypothetical protein
MTRTLQAAVKTALLAQESRVALFVRLELYDNASPPVAQFVRLTDLHLPPAVGISWIPPGEGAQTWYNLGGTLRVAGLPEAPGLHVAKAELVLQNADVSSVAEKFLNGTYINRNLVVYAVHLDADAVPIADGYLLFRGHMNGGVELSQTARQQGAPESTLRVTATSEIGELETIRGLYCTLAAHQQLFAGDKFFEYVPWLNGYSTRLTWGRA